MGEVHSRITRAGSWLEQLVNVAVRLTPQFLSIIFALGFAFYIRPSLALILLIGVALYSLVLIPTAPAIAEASMRSHRAYSDAYGDAHDVAMNVGSVKQAVAEQYERRKLYRNFLIRAYRKWSELRVLWGTLSIVQRLLITGIQLAIYIVGFRLILSRQLTIGELIMFNGYAAMFFGPFVQLGHNWEAIQNGITTLERAEKILSLDTEIYTPKEGVIIEKFRGEIHFNNVSFSYGKKQNTVLQNISFHVSPGERVALVGESGVGKSTLIDLISYYYKPTSGKVFIDGHPIQNLDLKFLRSQIAIVPQEILLFNDTVKNNIKYGAFGASDDAVISAAQKAHAHEFIEAFPKQYNQMVGERGIKLSMGQKQRIAIARAILRDPKILILDEPTSALDAKSEHYIQESLRELMQGRTTFIIAHRLSTVREVDRIFVLEKGQIIEEGNHEELIKKEDGVYHKLYEMQIGLS